jgi:sulfite reductase (NADPH) flavoprotein alpha-component
MFQFPQQTPLDPSQRQALEAVISGMDERQRAWLGGFLSAWRGPGLAVPTAVPAAGGGLLVLYGTESGNCEALADRVGKEAKKRGFRPKVRNMADAAIADLAAEGRALVVVSTWGDGEPPETAASFFKALMSEAPDLSGLSFSVCALGDTSYEKFCQTGKDIDARLAQLGAKRVADRRDCDVDYEEDFTAWLGKSLDAFGAAGAAAMATASSAVVVASVEYGKKNPFPAEVMEIVNLNGRGSSKETVHVELSLEGSGMEYEPGDALAVQPVNAPDVVAAVLAAARLGGTEEVEIKSAGRKVIADALREDLDITALSRAVLSKLAEAGGSAQLAALLGDDAKPRLKDYLAGRQVVDALADFAPQGLGAQELAGILRKLPPRLYSIASSPLAHPGEVHLTVGAVRYESHGRARKGVCSTYLADLLKAGDKAPVFVQPNRNFRLPQDGATPVIMVGPGTGIAPFRAFVEHRAALGCTGRNWLFMGDQHYLYDFLYQLEWQEHLRNGVLTRLDVAFSRDQPEKVYVQHRIAERSRELYAWLEEGAHFYVCGDASRMAEDVHQELLAAVRKEGGVSAGAAEAYVEDLKRQKRYQRDVY